MLKKAFYYLLILLTFSACKSSKMASLAPQTGVNFVGSKSLGSVLEIAKEQDKLVFLDIYTDWCLPCKMMDEDVFPDKALGDFMNEHFISYKVDAEKGTGPNVAFLFQVYAYPTLLFLDSEGNELVRKVGAAYHTELMQMAEQARMTRQRL